MLNILAVGAGGFLGAVCRYLISLMDINESAVFPVKTFAVNIVGCVVIGIIAVSVSRNVSWSQPALLFMKVGLCAGNVGADKKRPLHDSLYLCDAERVDWSKCDFYHRIFYCMIDG